MDAAKEIGNLVKKAQAGSGATPLSKMKPIDWFDQKYQNAMNGPEKKFDFRSQALKLLTPFRQRVGQHGADALARDFTRQFRDMQANPGKYDEKAQRAMLDQWKNRIGQFDRQQKDLARSRQLTNNRQAVVAPKTPKSLGTGWTGLQVSQGGNSISRVSDKSVSPTLNVAKRVGGQNYFNVGNGKLVAQNQLPSMQMMARWNTAYPNTPAGRKSYLASYMPSLYKMRPSRIAALGQIAKNDAKSPASAGVAR